MNSCIYNGEVTHTRFKPVRHFLKYKTFSLLIDLDEISQTATDKAGEKIIVDSNYINKNLGELTKDTDLSKFIL